MFQDRSGAISRTLCGSKQCISIKHSVTNTARGSLKSYSNHLSLAFQNYRDWKAKHTISNLPCSQEWQHNKVSGQQDADKSPKGDLPFQKKKEVFGDICDLHLFLTSFMEFRHNTWRCCSHLETMRRTMLKEGGTERQKKHGFKTYSSSCTNPGLPSCFVRQGKSYIDQSLLSYICYFQPYSFLTY